MENRIVYLNQAATSWPKPEAVRKTVSEVLAMPPQSQYRGTGPDPVFYDKQCRALLAKLFEIEDPQRIVFTSGATQALNLAILGLFKNPDSGNVFSLLRTGNAGTEQPGDTDRTDLLPENNGQKETVRTRRGIVLTQTEHNSVLRTVFDGLSEEPGQNRAEVRVVPCDRYGYVDMDRMREAVTRETALVVLNHCSNVTGALQDAKTVGRIARENGALFLLDASQSAGCLPVSVRETGADLMAFTGHKALFGMQGTGGLYIREGIPLRPLLFGGTGTDSAVMIPEKPFYEVGTQNLPGIASLYAGVNFILETGLPAIMEKERRLMRLLFEGLKSIPMAKVYADRVPEGTSLSFRIRGMLPSDVGYILSGTYHIAVRTGLHCSPLIHRAMGTENGGTVRVSISFLTEEADVLYFLGAVREIAAGIG